jgi:hypothetical protein
LSAAAAAEPEDPAAHGDSTHGISSDVADSAGVQLASVPERGLVLVAHPACGGIFSRSVVLLCRHELHQGSYGLILNKPLGSSLRHLHERLRQLQSFTGGGWSGSSGGGGGFGGALFGGGSSGGREGAFGGPGFAAAASATASGAVAARGSSSSGADIPAEQLQQMVDFLAWKDELAAAAAAARPDHDEHGNWIEGMYEEPEDGEGEDSELEDEVSMLGLSSGSEGEDDEEGAGLGSGPRARGEAAAAELGGLLLEALRGAQGSASEGEEAEFELEFESPGGAALPLLLDA